MVTQKTIRKKVTTYSARIAIGIPGIQTESFFPGLETEVTYRLCQEAGEKLEEWAIHAGSCCVWIWIWRGQLI